MQTMVADGPRPAREALPLPSPHMPSPLASPNRRGITAMVLAMALFVANDALVKYVSTSMPTAQLVFIRGLFASVLLLLAALAVGALRPAEAPAASAWRHLTRRPVLLRAGLDALGTMAFLSALFHMPIANASAINLASPLFIAAYAALAWRERIGRGRWLAILVGFAGVLLVVQPAAEQFNAWSLMCLLGTALQAGRDLVTRRIAANVPSILITLSTAWATVLLAGPWSLLEGWGPLDARQLALLATASVFLSIAYFLVTVAMRSGEVGLVVPFRYSALVFALLAGWLVWRDIPNALAWGGIVLLVCAGLALVMRRG